MSTAYLVAGVPLAELLKKERVTTFVTRYNEIDGAPYAKEVSHETWKLCGKPIESGENLLSCPDELFSKKGPFSGLGLDAFYAGYDIPECIIIGLSVAEVGDCNGPDERVVKATTDLILAALASAADKLMHSIGYNGRVDLFLLMRESY